MKSQGWLSLPLPRGHRPCDPSSQPLSPLYVVEPMVGCGAAAGGGEQGAVAIPGWAWGEVGGLVAAGGWVLWGETSVQGLRKEQAKLGGCRGLVPATRGALMAARPCSGGSKTPAGIWPELASHRRGGSRAATSPLCPRTGVL